MKDMGKGNIYQVCKIIRMQGIKAGLVVIGIWALLYLVLMRGNFVDMFYGINRIYLIILALGIGYVLVNGICMLFQVDKIKIQKLVAEQGIMLAQYENNLDEGIAFYQKGSSDLFFISNQYGLIRSHGAYHVIRTDNIMKLGIDQMNNGQVQIQHMHCLMKDGAIYSFVLSNQAAYSVAEYMKRNMKANLELE